MAQILNSVIGHKNIISRLKSVITSGHIGSCYLFCGPSGIGKKKVAIGFIQQVLCSVNKKGEPACGECAQCIKVERGEHEEVLQISPEGTQIKIQQAEEIHRFLNLQKIGEHRFIVINEAQLLNPQAGNSLLKILEEPPAETTFFLIAPSDRAVLKTLRSRSQIIYFSSLTLEDLRKHTDLPDWILLSSQGRMDLLEQLKDASLNEIRQKSFDVLRTALQSHFKNAITDLKEILGDKENALKLIALWQQIFRDILLYKDNLQPQIHSDQTQVMASFQNVSSEKIHMLFEKLLQIERDIYGNVDRTLAFENFILDLRNNP